MKKYADAFLRNMTTIMDFVIAILLSAAIIVMIVQLALSFGNLTDLTVYPNYDDLLTSCFNLIIGVEMIRMLYLHTPTTIFEVLVFAISRQIIIDHSVAFNTLLGVLSIALLFAIRKFLFLNFDAAEKITFRASQKVRHVNHVLHTHIPYSDNETLLDVLLAKMEKHDIEYGIGACVYFQDYGLRISKITNGKITRIEVIRSIQ